MTARFKFSIQNTRRHLLGLGLAALMGAPLAAFSADFRLGHIYAIDSPTGQAAVRMADLVRERTKGEVNIRVFPAGQLGGDEQMGRELSRGLLDFAFINHGSASGLDRRLDMLALPFVVSNFQEVDKIYYGNGVIPSTSKDAMQRLGIKHMGWFESEFRSVANSKRPIQSAADLKGLKLRVPAARSLRMFFDDAGSQTVVMPITELFTALQQGTVDGQDNGPVLTLTSKLYESTKFVTLTNHVFSHGAIVASQAVFDKLSAANQKIVQDTVREVSAEQIQKQRAMFTDAVAKLKAAGVQVNELSPDARAEMRKISLGVWNKMADAYGEDRIALLRKEVEELNK
jgi:TRAP-type transport system periplasmic protein